MMDKDVKFTVADVDQNMSNFLQDNFGILLGDLNNEKYKPIKLAKVEWDKLLGNPSHWENFKFIPPPEKEK